MENSVNLADVIFALNNGTLNFDDLVTNLKTEKTFVRVGISYRELVFENVTKINGALANVYHLSQDKVDITGKVIEKNARKKKAPAPVVAAGKK